MRISKLETIDTERYYKKLISKILKDWNDNKISSNDAIIKLSYIGTIDSESAILSIKLKDMFNMGNKNIKDIKGSNLRGTGRTTRLVDYFVQRLFTEGSTGIIKDHHDTDQENTLLYDKIMKRLFLEHFGVNVTTKMNGNNFVIDLNK